MTIGSEMTTPALAENVRGKGRHYRTADDTLVPSVTNIIGILDKPALPRWAANEVAKRAATLKFSLGDLSDNEVVDILKGAPWSKSTRAADRGTDIHAYLEHLLNRWEPDDLSEDAEPYRQAADDWFEYAGQGFEQVQTEVTMFHPLYAGTTDLVGMLDDRWHIVDFKTSKAIYDEAALQLSALSGCYTLADGSPVPWRDADGNLIYQPTLVVVRIGEDGWEEKTVADPWACQRAFFGLLEAWNWKHTKAYV